MNKTLREQVVAEIEVFLRVTGISKTRFGLESVNNDKIFDQMKAGAHPRANTIDAMRQYMREQRELKKKAREAAKAQAAA